MTKQRTKVKLPPAITTTIEERQESYNKVKELIEKMKALRIDPDEVFLGKKGKKVLNVSKP